MAPLRVAVVLALGLALASPFALGASTQGSIEAGEFRLAPASTFDSPGLAALFASADAPSLELDLASVSIHRLGERHVLVGAPASMSFNQGAVDERADFASAKIRLEPGSGEQRLALRADGPASATLERATVRGVGGVLLAEASPDTAQGCLDEYATTCIDVFGAHEIAGAADVAVSGGLTLLLHGPTLVLDDGSGEFRYASGVTSERDATAASVVENVWVIVVAKEATGSIASSDARLFSPVPTLRTSAVEFERASGAMRVGALDYRAHTERVSATGDLVLAPEPVPPALERGAPGEATYVPSFTTRVSGDVQSINLGATSVFLATAAEKAGAAAILAALGAAIMYYWPRLAFAGAALYTRLNKPDILENDVRSAIYEIIRANPGISAREVHRRCEQSWGTVVYHLRQLERHHLVVSRNLGRTRNYYENHGKYRGMEEQLACLQSERARVLARAIANTPGITQEALAQSAGFPQPTTSYYVRKLKQAGLVEEQREGRYVKYVPHADLPRFIAISESSVTGGPASSGVQA